MQRIADFYSLEKPIVELKEQIDALQESDDPTKKEQIAALCLEIEQGVGEDRPSADGRPHRPARPPPQEALFAGLFREPVHGFHGDARGPAIRGRSGHRGRPGLLQRPDRRPHRPPERTHDPGPHRTELRPAQPRGLPQGPAHHADGRKVRFPGHHLHRHPGSLSGDRRRGTGPGRGHRQQPQGHRQAPHPHHQRRHRRGRERRRAGHRLRGRPAHPRARVLLGHLARGLRVHPLEGQSKVDQAAENLGLRSGKLLELGIVDKIVPEPPGGAHIDPEQTYRNLDKILAPTLKKLEAKPVEELLEERYRKVRKLGVFVEK